MNRKAFTLFELLISTSLLALLLIVMFQLIYLYMELNRKGSTYYNEVLDIANIAEKLDEDLKQLPYNIETIVKQPNPQEEVVSIIVKEELETFIESYEQVDEEEVALVEKEVVIDQEEMLVENNTAITSRDMVGEEKSLTLKHTQYWLHDGLQRISKDNTLTADSVISAKFKYFDGIKWNITWDSRNTHILPVAVEMVVQLKTNPTTRYLVILENTAISNKTENI